MKAVLRRTITPFAGLVLLVGVTACETSKSANPLSPAIAGPMEGVEIGQPKLLEPLANQQIPDSAQPFTLIIENPGTTSPRPFTLRLQIATDINFSKVAWTREGIQPGGNGQTKFKMPEKLKPGRAYFWRAQADDGANRGAWSAPRGFEVLMPTFFGKPSPKSPVNNEQVSTNRPTLVVGNADAQGPVGQASYYFQVSRNSSFSDLVFNKQTPQQGGETKITTSSLPASTSFYWRARVSDGKTTGEWSETETFRTGATPKPSPTPGPTDGWPNNGPALVAFIAARYPERLAPVGSLHARENNTEFLRNRIIEAGICGGMELALNLKRGGPEISVDFIAHKKNGTWVGIDFASGMKLYGQTMSLYWGDYGPYATSQVVPTPYPHKPNCG